MRNPDEIPADAGTPRTEWKVRIATLASFIGSLVLGTLLEIKTPELIDELPEGLRVIVGGAAVAAATWFSGRAARSRPQYISDSTIEAVREYLRRH